MYIFTNMYAHEHTHTHTHTLSLFSSLSVCMYFCTHLQTHIKTHIRACMRARTHTHANKHVNKKIYFYFINWNICSFVSDNHLFYEHLESTLWNIFSHSGIGVGPDRGVLTRWRRPGVARTSFFFIPLVLGPRNSLKIIQFVPSLKVYEVWLGFWKRRVNNAPINTNIPLACFRHISDPPQTWPSGTRNQNPILISRAQC